MKKSKGLVLDHADIVCCHICNQHCPHCVDKFLNSTKSFISHLTVERFLILLRKNTKKKLEVLLLGGEPTCIGPDNLIKIANLIKQYGFSPIISTNGSGLRTIRTIFEIIPHFDWTQITVNSDWEINLYKMWRKKVNIKLAGDESLTLEKFNWFIKATKKFKRRSISMYSTEDFHNLCTDERVWAILNKQKWKRNGSYLYTFYKGVRIKKFIEGETNIIDEPTVPKLYPNGAYNKTWNNEKMDEYLGEF